MARPRRLTVTDKLANLGSLPRVWFKTRERLSPTKRERRAGSEDTSSPPSGGHLADPSSQRGNTQGESREERAKVTCFTPKVDPLLMTGSAYHRSEDSTFGHRLALTIFALWVTSSSPIGFASMYTTFSTRRHTSLPTRRIRPAKR